MSASSSAASIPVSPNAVEGSRRWSRTAWTAVGVLALLIAIGAIYGPTLDAPFIFDDEWTVISNPSLVRLWPLVAPGPEGGPLNPPGNFPTSARPIVNLSLAVNYYFGQLEPRGYRMVNTAIHAGCALLLWGLVAGTLRLEYFGGRFTRAAGPLGFVAALVWALHPLTIEGVAYLTQRTESSMALCYLATLFASLRYWTATRPLGRAGWLATATLACALGMMCKEVMVSAPVVVLLFERTFLAGSFLAAIRRSWPLYLGLALGWIPLAAVYLSGHATPLAGFDQGYPATTWWLTQATVLLLYARLAVWPWPLVITYDLPRVTHPLEAWPALVVVGLAIAVVLWHAWRGRSLGFIGLAVLAVLAPTSLIPMFDEVAAERRMYLPLAAIVALAVVGGYALLVRLATRTSSPAAVPRWSLVALGTLAATVAVVFVTLDARRLALYQDPLLLWQDAERWQPDNAMVQANIGMALNADGRREEGFKHTERAVQIKPHWFQTHYNLALAYESAGEVYRAIDEYDATLHYRPAFVPAHNNLGRLLAAIGKTSQAIDHYRQAVEIEPHFVAAHTNLAIALFGQGETGEALAQFRTALALKPSVETYANLAGACGQLGRFDEAIPLAEKALELARANGQDALADQIEAGLDAYRQQAAR
jgi:protein O-mannosyl-transferase